MIACMLINFIFPKIGRDLHNDETLANIVQLLQPEGVLLSHILLRTVNFVIYSSPFNLASRNAHEIICAKI
jgi:hypothetical protein